MLQQKVVLQRKAAVLIVQLREEVMETDGGKGVIIGRVLPRRPGFTMRSRHDPTHTKEMLLSVRRLSKDNAFLSFIFSFQVDIVFISNLHSISITHK